MTEGAMGLSAADVAAVTRNNDYDGFGNGGWIWIILLAFLFRGNWGGYGGYGNESPLVSEEFIKRDIFNTNQNVSNTACQTQRDVLENRYTNQLCCCETQKEILQSRYDAALQAQTIQAQLASCCCDLKTAIHAEGEATRGLIQGNTIQDLRDKLAERDRDLSAQTSRFLRWHRRATSSIPFARSAACVYYMQPLSGGIWIWLWL